MEGVWIAEQERIARAVIDSDDACWLLDSANAHDTATGAAAGAGASGEGCEGGSTGGGKIPPGPIRGAGRSRIDAPAPSLPRRLRLIGGVDVSFVKGSEDNACATLMILEFPSLNVVYEASDRVTMEYPYVSGFLAFREVHHLVRLIEKLRQQRPDLEPDVVFVDGNGRLHPRSAGLACHLGVIAGLRTVGLSKTFLHVDGLTKARVRERSQSLLSTGERESQLVGTSGAVWGTALVPKARKEKGFFCPVTNPIFVSVGHRVSLETSVALTKAVGRYRVPEPVRQADIRSREVIRLWLEEQKQLLQDKTRHSSGELG